MYTDLSIDEMSFGYTNPNDNNMYLQITGYSDQDEDSDSYINDVAELAIDGTLTYLVSEDDVEQDELNELLYKFCFSSNKDAFITKLANDFIKSDLVSGITEIYKVCSNSSELKFKEFYLTIYKTEFFDVDDVIGFKIVQDEYSYSTPLGTIQLISDNVTDENVAKEIYEYLQSVLGRDCHFVVCKDY